MGLTLNFSPRITEHRWLTIPKELSQKSSVFPAQHKYLDLDDDGGDADLNRTPLLFC